DKKYPGVPNLNIHIIDTNSFFIGDIPIQPILVWHLNMPVFGYKFGNFTYITDANRIDEKEQKLISNSTILVLNALRKEKHISHFTLDEATQLAQVLQAQKTYFTHISHQLGLYNEINNSLPKNIELAYDGLVVEVS
ncbi:MAG TPA: MBL fold metallo-hydrolase, partial [Chitinophagaceae bacterium]|nr:MBL fold metallo-hydrolase [Chitinophagaceae bacterium]